MKLNLGRETGFSSDQSPEKPQSNTISKNIARREVTDSKKQPKLNLQKYNLPTDNLPKISSQQHITKSFQ